jgi:UDP-N-acetylglucosamine--N-acetylmuramyl-(pentapeptide) pyrophosphoryl-undecaprenol N-acetylglucosamine transferase
VAKKVLVIAGGTGGHVFPALAVARLLQQQRDEVAWLGTKKGLENKVVPEDGIKLFKISVVGLRGNGILRWLISPFRLVYALFKSMCIVRKFNPDVVLAMGGFVTGPGGLAAWLLRKKLVLHEQNAIPGMTNKILSRFATKVLTGFPLSLSAQKQTLKHQFHYIGNPVRAEIAAISAPAERLAKRKGPIRLFIFGGSQGALFFNQALPQALALLAKEELPEIWHQAGANYFEVAEKSYGDAKLKVRLDKFISNMTEPYSWADLIICRAGALTIAELSAVGIASVLIPFPYAVDDHQTANAEFLVKANASLLLQQNEFTPEKLAKLLSGLMVDRGCLLEMAENARSLRKVNVTENIIKEL